MQLPEDVMARIYRKVFDGVLAQLAGGPRGPTVSFVIPAGEWRRGKSWIQHQLARMAAWDGDADMQLRRRQARFLNEALERAPWAPEQTHPPFFLRHSADDGAQMWSMAADDDAILSSSFSVRFCGPPFGATAFPSSLSFV